MCLKLCFSGIGNLEEEEVQVYIWDAKKDKTAAARLAKATAFKRCVAYMLYFLVAGRMQKNILGGA